MAYQLVHINLVLFRTLYCVNCMACEKCGIFGECSRMCDFVLIVCKENFGSKFSWNVTFVQILFMHLNLFFISVIEYLDNILCNACFFCNFCLIKKTIMWKRLTFNLHAKCLKASLNVLKCYEYISERPKNCMNKC